MPGTGFIVWTIVSASAVVSFVKADFMPAWEFGLTSGLIPIGICGLMYGVAQINQRKTLHNSALPLKQMRRTKFQFRDETEALEFIRESYSEWKIGDEEIKQLAFLHFFGWTIADDCRSPPLRLIRGSESMVFDPTKR